MKLRRPAWLIIDDEASPADYRRQTTMLQWGFPLAGIAILFGVFFQFVRPWLGGFDLTEESKNQAIGLVDLAVQAAVYLALFIPMARGFGVIIAGLPIFVAIGLDIGFRLFGQVDPPWLMYAVAVLVISNALLAAYYAKQAEGHRRGGRRQRAHEHQSSTTATVSSQTQQQTAGVRDVRRMWVGQLIGASLVLALAAFGLGRRTRR